MNVISLITAILMIVLSSLLLLFLLSVGLLVALYFEVYKVTGSGFNTRPDKED